MVNWHGAQFIGGRTSVAGDSMIVRQRRPLVLMFADIAGSTQLSAVLEVEDYVELLTKVRGCLAEAVATHAGTVVRIDGDGALCVFGYPDSFEDAGRRAIECAIDFSEMVAALPAMRDGKRVSIHTGIHAGLVSVLPGDVVRGTIEVLGHPTNVAARICDLASPDRLLVSIDALGIDRRFFETVAVEPLAPLGDMPAIPLVHVMGRTGFSDRLQVRMADQTAPYLGRQAERSAVASWMRGAEPPLLLVHGDAGMGKSRFLRDILEMRANPEGTAVLGSCEGYPAVRPLQALRQIAEGIAPQIWRDWSPADFLDNLRLGISRHTVNSGLLILIDDWQWADETTVAFIGSLAAAGLPQLRMLLASRERASRLVSEQGCHFVELTPLSDDFTRTLIEKLLPRADPQSATWICRAAGGNPLLVEEMCRAPALLQHSAKQVPTSFRLSALVEQRLAVMPADLAGQLALCAVIGLAVPQRLFEEIAAIRSPRAALEALAAAGWLNRPTDDDIWRFRHGLIRDAIYAQLSSRQRSEIHGNIAASLLAQEAQHGAGEDIEALAHHMAQADHPLALSYAIKAGDHAFALGSLDRALAHYRSAIDLLSRSDRADANTLVNALGARFISAAIPDPHRDHLLPLQQLVGTAERSASPDSQEKSRYWLASLHYAMGFPAEAKRTLAQQGGAPAVRLADQSELRDALLGQISVLGNYLPQARKMLDRAILAMRDSRHRKIRPSLIYTLGMRGQIYGEQGEFLRAAQDFDEAIGLAGENPPAMIGSLLSQRAAVELWQERYDACRSTMESCRVIGDRVGSRYVMMIARALIAYVDLLQERPGDHLSAIENSCAWFADTDSRYSLGLVLGWAAHGAFRAGDNRRAAAHAAQAIALGRQGLRWGAPLAYRIAALTAGSPASAEHAFARAMALARRMDSRRDDAANLLVRAMLDQRAGRTDAAHQSRSMARQLRQSMGLSGQTLIMC